MNEITQLANSNEIKCPHCGTVFTIDEAQYADIAQQVRTVEFEKEIHARLAEAAKAQEMEVALAVANANKASQKSAAAKDLEIQRLSAELKAAATDRELAIAKAVSATEKELSTVQGELALQAAERKVSDAALKETHAKELASKDELIERYKDMKARMSVKMLGETLEQHCEIEFNRIRSLAFPNAEFGKDNDASAGTKGDYVFRDFGDDDVEYISIMFEMKNEADITATKKKNSDFFAKLDKDRNEKGCEYAVLVSMLEEDSDLYTGITDVSHLYPKMFVVRPQFFLAIIALLRNAAQSTIQVRAELEQIKQQSIDITNFEAKLFDFQTRFTKNVDDAATQYDKAIATIDDAIKKLEGTKEALRLWLKHLNTASGRANDLTIRALTRGNETMKQKFAELESPEEPEAA